MNGSSDTGVGCVSCSAVALSPHQMQRPPTAVCHKDVRAVKDSAIVLRADRVETLDAEPTALGPETVRGKNEAVRHLLAFHFTKPTSPSCLLSATRYVNVVTVAYFRFTPFIQR